jgi:rRNA biogenesis protein RRP5
VRWANDTQGTIRRLTEKALFININGSVDGIVYPLHYADIRLKHPEKRFKSGSTVKARVLALDPARNRIILTIKKSLIESELDIVTGIEGVKTGLITPGVVSKILDKGCLVDMFGGVKAFVPLSEAR